MHYFTLTDNVEGVDLCFKNQVHWMKDTFDNTPLEYALKSKDKHTLEAVIKGIFETEHKERVRIMREVPLVVLLKCTAVYMPSLLREAGVSFPDY